MSSDLLYICYDNNGKDETVLAIVRPNPDNSKKILKVLTGKEVELLYNSLINTDKKE